jgi:hypothetical protein
MGWHKGMCFNKDGKEIVIYLKEKGVPFRWEQISTQKYPKSRYPLLNLKNRSLYGFNTWQNYPPPAGPSPAYLQGRAGGGGGFLEGDGTISVSSPGPNH